MTVVAVFASRFLFSPALWVLFAVTRAVVVYLDARAEARFHQEIETIYASPGPWRRRTLRPRSCHKSRGELLHEVELLRERLARAEAIAEERGRALEDLRAVFRRLDG
jgi:hypothetical protein